MCKKIYITDADVDALIEELKAQIFGMKSFGSIDIKKNFIVEKQHATVYFTEDAWNKLTALVREFDTEVEWHGCVNRISKNEFEIYDILVPPHVVTGSTVTADYSEYDKWMDNLKDDVFNHLHFHGHSHVTMGCTPSATDTKYRNDIVTQIPRPKKEDEEALYIFMIFNKKGEWSGEIYDIKENLLYETNDISIEVYAEGSGLLSDFIAEAKRVAVKETPKYVKTYNDYFEGKYKKTKSDPTEKAKTIYPYSDYYYCEDDDEWGYYNGSIKKL